MQALEECEAFAWERSKENVAPVHCGRNVDKLNVVLAEVDSSNHHSKLISQERELLHNIATYCGDDPLMSWLEYYKWVQEYFPSDVKKILAVLERITHEFKGNKKYRNDVRYMKLWVAYADKVEKPLEVFMFLHKHKIGDKLSLFYIAWAFLCEKSGKIKDAETIFNRGFQKNAEPRETLKKKYDEFNCRVIKAWTKSSEDNYEGSQRKKTRTSSTHGKTILRPTRGTSTTPTPLENLTNTMHTKSPDVTFSIYTEPNTPKITSNDEGTLRSSALKGSTSGDRVGSLHPGTVSRAPLTIDDNQLQTARKRPHPTSEVKTSQREHAKPKDIFRFNEGMLRDVDGAEYCFEELRAKRYESKNKPAPSAFLVNAADYMSSNVPSGSSDPLQQAALQDITITTKLALNDINDMFRSPIKQPANQSVRIPRTEEPIIRKLQFSSFCVAEDNDAKENLLVKSPSRFKPNNEENCTSPKSTEVSTQGQISGATSSRLKNKDVLGFSYCQSMTTLTSTTTMYAQPRARETLDPYNPVHRYKMVQSEHVALSLCSMADRVVVHTCAFDAPLPVEVVRGELRLKSQVTIPLCIRTHCKFTRLLGSGSYASVYASQLVEESSSGDKMTEVAVKHETRVGYLPWEFYCVNEIISRLSKDEQHPSFETIIRMYTLHVFQNATLLIQQRGDRGTLHGLVNKYAQHGRRIPEQIAVYYAYQMFATVDIVHKARFLHGDIKPDNWILVDGQSYWDTRKTFSTGAVCLIDFGRAIDLDYYPKDFAFCGDCHASGFQCIEMLTKETWTYQIDTFGLCASIHLLLFGDYMEVKYISKTGKWMPKRPWKRHWQCQLWSDLFSTFLNIPPGSTTQPSLQWWCSKLERYFTDNETNKADLHRHLRAQDKMFRPR